MIILYDDAIAREFEPFATTRPLGEVRAGALLTRERWALWFGHPVTGALSSPHLSEFAEFDAPEMVSVPVRADVWLVNSRALPVFSAVDVGAATVIRIGERVAAVHVHGGAHDARLADGSLSLDELAPSDATSLDVDGVWLDETWDIIRHLPMQLSQDIPALAATLQVRTLALGADAHCAAVLGDSPVYLEDGATIEPFVVFDTTAGPVLIRRGARVQSFTRIVGPCYIGQDTTVTTDRIACAAIGDNCRVHGELSTTVFIGHANKGHDGFVGHSIVGRWVNMGAGTITSNLKNTYGNVAMWTTRGVRDTGLQFAGTFFGDHAKTGIGMRLTTGCVLGAGANVMDAMPPKAVAPFSWGTRAPYDVFDAAKFADIAARMMSRRGVTLDTRYRSYLTAVMSRALADTRWPAR